MAYVKKYATRAELSAALSRANAMRKNKHNCGRKRKIPDEDGRSSSLYLRNGDREVFAIIARAKGLAIVEFLHELAVALKAKTPELFNK